LHTDTAFAEACLADQNLSSGTTALTVLVLGRFVKNSFSGNINDLEKPSCGSINLLGLLRLTLVDYILSLV
jgi:hypothetical protein